MIQIIRRKTNLNAERFLYQLVKMRWYQKMNNLVIQDLAVFLENIESQLCQKKKFINTKMKEIGKRSD